MSRLHSGLTQNVANIGTLTHYLTAYGAAYRPANPNLSISALQQRQATTAEAGDAFIAADVAHRSAADRLAALTKQAKKIFVKVENAYPVCVEDAEGLEHIRSLRRSYSNRVHQSKTVQPLDAANATEKRKISGARSIQHRIDCFAELIETVSLHAEYAPNEVELTVAGLRSLLDELKEAAFSADESKAALDHARLLRDQLLFDRVTGLVHLVQTVKRYVKSVFGVRSEEYRQLAGIKMTQGK